MSGFSYNTVKTFQTYNQPSWIRNENNTSGISFTPILNKELIDYFMRNYLAEHNIDENILIEGESYYLQANACDGTEAPKKVYKVYAFINNDKFSFAVMQRGEGNTDTIFSLTRNICSYLNIPYADGLCIMPLGLNWHHISNDNKLEDFNPNDLSTYATQFGTTNYIAVKINGCDSDLIRNKSFSINSKIDGIGTKHYSITKIDGDICAIISLVCIDQNLLKNKTINDIFDFSWNDSEPRIKIEWNPQKVSPKDGLLRVGPNGWQIFKSGRGWVNISLSQSEIASLKPAFETFED